MDRPTKIKNDYSGYSVNLIINEQCDTPIHRAGFYRPITI